MAWAWDEEWHIDQVRKMDSVAVSLFVEILEGEENGSSIFFSRCRCSVAATFQWAAGRMPLTSRPSITQRKVSPAASEEGGGLEVWLNLLLSILPHVLSRCVGLLGILIFYSMQPPLGGCLFAFQCNAGGCAIVVLWLSTPGRLCLDWRVRSNP